MNGFSQTSSGTCRNVSRMDLQNGWAVTKVTISCPSDKPHWTCWKSGHTPQWLAAAVVLMTRKDKDNLNRHYISGVAANQQPSALTPYQKGQDSNHVRHLRSGRTVWLPLTTPEGWGRPISLTPRPPSLYMSLTPKPHSSASKAPPPRVQMPLGPDQKRALVHQTGRRRGGIYGICCQKKMQTPCRRHWCDANFDYVIWKIISNIRGHSPVTSSVAEMLLCVRTCSISQCFSLINWWDFNIVMIVLLFCRGV